MARNYRTCIFTPTASGGHARYTWELANGLSQHLGDARRVEVVSSVDLEQRFRDVPYIVQPILPALPARDSYRNIASWALGRATHYAKVARHFVDWLATRPDIDVVHLQEMPQVRMVPMIKAIRRLGKGVFHTVHNIVPHRNRRICPGPLMERRLRASRLACDGLFVHTHLLRQQLSASLGRDHPPISVTEHGIWTIDEPADRPALGDRLAWKKLLFFGSIRMNKGLDMLLRGSDHLQDFEITIAGEPIEPDYFNGCILPLIQERRAAGAKINLIDRFVSDEEAGELFATHSAVVMPYTRGFVAQSGVAYMALAYRLPVIAAEVGGLRDLFKSFRIGASYAEPSTEFLVAATHQLFDRSNPEFVGQQIEAARDAFSWRATAAATASGYEAFLRKETPIRASGRKAITAA